MFARVANSAPLQRLMAGEMTEPTTQLADRRLAETMPEMMAALSVLLQVRGRIRSPGEQMRSPGGLICSPRGRIRSPGA